MHDENHTKQMTYVRQFRLKEPRRSETISGEKCYLYRSTRLGYIWPSLSCQPYQCTYQLTRGQASSLVIHSCQVSQAPCQRGAERSYHTLPRIRSPTVPRMSPGRSSTFPSPNPNHRRSAGNANVTLRRSKSGPFGSNLCLTENT